MYRAFEERDLDAVVDLLVRRFEGWRALPDPRSFFRWKHLQNPFGPSLMSVTEHHDGEVIAFRAFLRWEVEGPKGRLVIARGADAVTDAQHERRGLWEAMTRRDLRSLVDDGVDMALAHGNERSRAGYIKLGWQLLGTSLPLVRLLRVQPSQQSFLPVSAGDREVDLVAASEMCPWPRGPAEGLVTAWSPSFATWRYGDVPHPRHHVLRMRAGQSGEVIVMGRLRSSRGRSEFRVGDVRASGSGVPIPAKRLRHALRALQADYALTWAAPRRPRYRSPVGLSVPVPQKATSVLATPLAAPGVVPAWNEWRLTLGDLESYF